jgi:hypothetical protein
MKNQGILKAVGATLETSVSSVFEVIAEMKAENQFAERKKVLLAIMSLCGKNGILQPDEDVLVAKAFKHSLTGLDYSLVFNAVETIQKANTWQEAEAGIPDLLKQKIYSINFDYVYNWDNE